MPGASRAPRLRPTIAWDDYTADHIAVLDHLRIDRCHLFGQCIGGSFILNLIKKTAPAGRQRNPGAADRPRWPNARRTVGGPFQGLTGKSLKDHPEATPDVLDAFYRNLYAPGFRLLRRPRLRADGPDAVPGAGRQRRGAPLRDLGGAVDSCCRTASSSPSGRPGRRSMRRAFGSRNSCCSTRHGGAERQPRSISAPPARHPDPPVWVPSPAGRGSTRRAIHKQNASHGNSAMLRASSDALPDAPGGRARPVGPARSW